MAREAARQTGKTWFRDIVHSFVDGRNQLQLPAITRQAMEAAAQEDPERYAALLAEWQYEAAYSFVAAMFAPARATRTEPFVRRVIDVNADQISQKVVEFRSKFPQFWEWYEHAHDRHIALPKMTRRDLLIAAEEREKRGKHELKIAQMLRTLAEALQTDEEVVEDRFTLEDVTSIYEKLSQPPRRGRPRKDN